MKIRAYFNFGTKFARIYNFWSKSSIPSTIFIISKLACSIYTNAKFHKNWNAFQFSDQISQIYNFGSRSSIPVNILMISMSTSQIKKLYNKINHKISSCFTKNYGKKQAETKKSYKIDRTL